MRKNRGVGMVKTLQPSSCRNIFSGVSRAKRSTTLFLNSATSCRSITERQLLTVVRESMGEEQ